MSQSVRRGMLLFSLAVAVGVWSGCAAQESCQSDTTCGQSVQTCCTDSSCYYTVRGQRFNCSGTNCNSAASQAVRAACGRKAEPDAVAPLLGAAVEARSGACEVLP
jgi:hypothetical protein